MICQRGTGTSLRLLTAGILYVFLGVSVSESASRVAAESSSPVHSVIGGYRDGAPPKRGLKTITAEPLLQELLGMTPGPIVALEALAPEQITGKRARQIGIGRDLTPRQQQTLSSHTLNWQRLSGGGYGASFRIASPGAVGLRLGLQVESVPASLTLVFSSPHQPAGEIFSVAGARVQETVARAARYSSATHTTPLFWSPTIRDQTVAVHLRLPQDVARDAVRLKLKQVSHLYKQPVKKKAQAVEPGFSNEFCEEDASCYPTPEADAVAHMQFTEDGGTALCTGTLLADSDPLTWRAYFLTANHCISDPAVALTLETFWFYETQSCKGPLKTPVHLWGGGDLLFTTEQTDVTLLELRDTPPAEAMYAGWTTNILTGFESVFGIHHPEGDLKKISFGDGGGYAECSRDDDGSFFCFFDAVGSFLRVNWWLGTVEPGSSGSGLFLSATGQLVGSLSHGPVGEFCASNADYSKFNRSFFMGLFPWLGEDEYPYKIRVTSADLDFDRRDEFVIAFARGNKIALYYYDDDGNLDAILPVSDAGDIDVTAGDFNDDGFDEIALATVNTAGNLAVSVFDRDGFVVGTGFGGRADSVSVAAGQLDNDNADEYVVGLVQADDRVAAISFDLDGARVGKAVGLVGTLPTVSVGQFDANASDYEYIIAHLSQGGTLETGTYQGDASFIGRGTGGKASNVTVASGDIWAGGFGDEYAVSLIQADGSLGVISFTGDGARLGKGVGGATRQPRVAQGEFVQTNPLDGLVVSLLQADLRPAAIFFDGKGIRLGKGVAPLAGVDADIDTGDIDGDGFDEAILAYVDQDGIPRWSIFSSDGAKLMDAR